MIKLTKSEADEIINLFPNIDDVFEHELDVKEIGYESYGVSVYNGWLCDTEYDKNIIRDKIKINEVNNLRMEFISSLYPSINLYSDDEEIYAFENKSELMEFITRNLNDEVELSFLCVDYNAIIEVSTELTEVVHFYKSTKIDQLKLKAHELALNVFDF